MLPVYANDFSEDEEITIKYIAPDEVPDNIEPIKIYDLNELSNVLPQSKNVGSNVESIHIDNIVSDSLLSSGPFTTTHSRIVNNSDGKVFSDVNYTYYADFNGMWGVTVNWHDVYTGPIAYGRFVQTGASAISNGNSITVSVRGQLEVYGDFYGEIVLISRRLVDDYTITR